MINHYMLDGTPWVDVPSDKFGNVRFRLWSATRRTAYFFPFTLRGVEYKGEVAFKDEKRPHSNERITIDYNYSYFRRTNYEEPTQATRGAVYAFVQSEAAKLFDDAALMKIAHVAEVDRMVAALEGELTAVREKETGIVERLTERRAQAKLGTPFCLHPATKYGTEVCSLPLGHKGAHDGERKR